MIIVLFAIFVSAVIVGIILLNASYDWDFVGIFAIVLGGIGAICCIIATCVLLNDAQVLKTVDDRIVMYQEENENIEEQISVMVKDYQKYESDIFTEVAPESSITLVSLYPELKADTLVQEQIAIHTANNQKIKELKEEKINGRVIRWWLYFGN